MFKVQTKDRKFVPLDLPKEKEWVAPFYFIQCADTQFGMEDNCDKALDPGSDPEIAWSSQMVRDIHNMSPPPRFVVLCGDLLDSFPIEQQDARNKEESAFKEVFSNLKVPLVCVCGNHDVGNQPTYKSVSNYKSSFGDDYFSFWCGGVFFIVLNSQYYEDSSLVPELIKQQEEWLCAQLKMVEREAPEHTVIFQHIPYFLKDPYEGKDYFNIELDYRIKLLDRLYDAGVRHIFTGHYHRNAGGFYKDMELVVTSAVGKQLGDDENGYRIVKVFKNKIEHKYYALGKSPTQITL